MIFTCVPSLLRSNRDATTHTILIILDLTLPRRNYCPGIVLLRVFLSVFREICIVVFILCVCLPFFLFVSRRDLMGISFAKEYLWQFIFFFLSDRTECTMQCKIFMVYIWLSKFLLMLKALILISKDTFFSATFTPTLHADIVFIQEIHFNQNGNFSFARRSYLQDYVASQDRKRAGVARLPLSNFIG